MKACHLFAAFSAYFCLFIDGFQADVPAIIGPDQVHVFAHLGKLLMLHCEAFINQEDVTLIYWLVNGTFPEDTGSERIVEFEESTTQHGEIIQRDLFLKKVTQEDFKSNFTCVVTNAFGVAQKFIKLTTSHKKRQKNKPLKVHKNTDEM